MNAEQMPNWLTKAMLTFNGRTRPSRSFDSTKVNKTWSQIYKNLGK